MSQTDSNKPSNKPTHGVFITSPGKDDKIFWNRIGGAWEHKDGKGFYIKLETLPVNGEMVIRKSSKPSKTAGAS